MAACLSLNSGRWAIAIVLGCDRERRLRAVALQDPEDLQRSVGWRGSGCCLRRPWRRLGCGFAREAQFRGQIVG